MKLFKRALVVSFVCVMGVLAEAQPTSAPKKATPAPAPQVTAEPATTVDTKETFAEYDSKKLWLAIPMGYIVGFGSGHMVQGRFHDSGYWYAIADGVGWFLIASGSGSCDIGDVSCQNSQEDRQTLGRTVIMASHFIQMVDTAIWGYKYKMDYEEDSVSYSLIPTPQGVLALGTLRF